MIRALSNMVAGGVDLIEAEARLARVHLVRLTALAAILLACAALTAIALIAVGAGVVVLLANSIGTGQALLWTGIGGVVLAAVITTIAWSGLRAED